MTVSSDGSNYALRGTDVLPLPEGNQPPSVTRFAPSPTGYLHIGHAYSALFAYEAALQSGGRFLLRLEDIDSQRCRPEFDQAVLDDLRWLGLYWDGGVRRQSEAFDTYRQALEALFEMDVIYPCFCTRKQIRAEVEESSRAPHGPGGELLYPGICRNLCLEERHYRIANGEPYAWRLHVDKAMAVTGELRWYDCRAGWVDGRPDLLGDVVIGRKERPQATIWRRRWTTTCRASIL